MKANCILNFMDICEMDIALALTDQHLVREHRRKEGQDY